MSRSSRWYKHGAFTILPFLMLPAAIFPVSGRNEWKVFGPARRTSRATPGTQGNRHTDCCTYSPPSNRSLRHTWTRSVPAAPAVDTLTSSQPFVSLVTF